MLFPELRRVERSRIELHVPVPAAVPFDGPANAVRFVEASIVAHLLVRSFAPSISLLGVLVVRQVGCVRAGVVNEGASFRLRVSNSDMSACECQRRLRV